MAETETAVTERDIEDLQSQIHNLEADVDDLKGEGNQEAREEWEKLSLNLVREVEQLRALVDRLQDRTFVCRCANCSGGTTS